MRFILLYLLSIFAIYADTVTRTVVNVIDGDTITVLDADNTQRKVRLYGIDAPESDQFGGVTAFQNLEGILMENRGLFKYSNIEIEKISDDKYGRIVAKVYKDGVYLNKIMLERGQAWLDYRYIKKEDDDLRAAEEKGEKKRLSFCAPWNFRLLKKKEKTDFEIEGLSVEFYGGMKIGCVFPYVFCVKRKGDEAVFIQLSDKHVVEEDYPYREEIIIKMMDILEKFKKYSDDGGSLIKEVIMKKTNEKDVFIGDIMLESIFRGKKMEGYLFHWLSDDGYLDEFYINEMSELRDGFNTREFIMRSRGKGFRNKKITVTPHAWLYMNHELKSYLLREIYELTPQERGLKKNEEHNQPLPENKNKNVQESALIVKSS